MARTILHLDMDAFYAAIEVRRNPELAGKPLVVGGRGDPTRRGVVATCSYEARRFGVHSGMPLRTAHRLCPDAVFLPVDMATYRAVSKQMKAVLLGVSNAVEGIGLDEAFVDLTETRRDPVEVARELKRDIFEATGLTCSVGIAVNKLLAKIASDLEKPDGLTVIGPGDLEARIWPLAARKIWGIGPRTGERLAELGIETIGELAEIPEGELIDLFGESAGRRLFRTSHGIDERPVVAKRTPKSMGHETTFQADVSDVGEMEAAIRALAARVHDELETRGFLAANVTVKVRFADFETLSRQVSLPRPTKDPETLEWAALACFRKVGALRAVRLLGVRAGHLVART